MTRYQEFDVLKLVMNFFKFKSLFLLSFIVFFIAVGSLSMPSSASAQTTLTKNIDVNCTSSGQLCEPAYSTQFQTSSASVIKVNYKVGPLHCSSSKIHFFIDDVEKYVSDWLGWTNAPAPNNTLPLSTGLVDLGSVSSGTHTLSIKAEGKVAGCNTGKVSSWQGTVDITTTPAQPAQMMTCSYVSDTSNTVEGGGNAVATAPNPFWTASIPGATWIWSSALVENPKIDTVKKFNKSFYLTLPVSSASIAVSSDNKHDVGVNGTNYFSGDSNWVTPANYTFATTSFKDGQNTLNVTGTNWGLDTTPELNPAGVLYKFTITAAYCGVNPPPVVNTGNTKFAFDILLHGIGKAGDSASPGIGGNMSPLHQSRTVTVEVYNGQQSLVTSQQGIVNYASASGSFTGIIDMGQLASGTYEVRAKLSQSLQGIKTVPVKSGTTVKIPNMTLITGDANDTKSNNPSDNSFNIVNALDYNMLLDCYSEFSPAKACDPAKFVKTDLTDDNKVNLSDLNLFLREMTNLYAP